MIHSIQFPISRLVEPQFEGQHHIKLSRFSNKYQQHQTNNQNHISSPQAMAQTPSKRRKGLPSAARPGPSPSSSSRSTGHRQSVRGSTGHQGALPTATRGSTGHRGARLTAPTGSTGHRGTRPATVSTGQRGSRQTTPTGSTGNYGASPTAPTTRGKVGSSPQSQDQKSTPRGKAIQGYTKTQQFNPGKYFILVLYHLINDSTFS